MILLNAKNEITLDYNWKNANTMAPWNLGKPNSWEREDYRPFMRDYLDKKN